MSIAGSQQQIVLQLLQALRPQLRRDVALPVRIQGLFAQHKEFGSRDRRLYREMIYTTVRYLPWIEPLLDSDADRAVKVVAWLAADTKDTAGFRAALCADLPAAGTLAERAAFLGADAAALLPAWFRTECPEAFASPEIDAQLTRAPLWLRLQADDPAPVVAEFQERGWLWRESDVLHSAWQMLGDGDVTKTNAYERGAVEVQDLGSQLVLESIGVESGSRWFDACAGAGGKTLQLARLLGPAGSVDAFDVRAEALAELSARAARAMPAPETSAAISRMAPIRVLHRAPAASADPSTTSRKTAAAAPAEALYDGVLVDAPCSGSGTWRRSPHLKWATSPKLVADRAALQSVLLGRFAGCVRPGGRLVYATCSLARRENEAVIEAFLAARPEFKAVSFAQTFGFEPRAPGMTILQSRHDTDGFFVASLRRR